MFLLYQQQLIEDIKQIQLSFKIVYTALFIKNIKSISQKSFWSALCGT